MQKYKKIVTKILLLFVLSLFIVACSSDDDSGFSRKAVPSKAIDITSANQVQIAGLIAGGGQASGIDTGKGDVQVANPGGSTAANIQMLQMVNKTIDLKSIASSKTVDAVRQATAIRTVNCFTGSVTTVINYADDTRDTITVGDSKKIIYNNCDHGPDKEKINGAKSIVVDGVVDNGLPNALTFINHPLIISAFVVAEGKYVTVISEGRFITSVTAILGGEVFSIRTGDYGMYAEASTGEVLLSYADLTFTKVGTNLTIDGTYRSESTELQGSIALIYNDVSRPIAAARPTSGNIVIIGADATLTLIFSPTDVTLELDLGSNGEVDETRVVTWTTLDQVGPLV